MVLACIGYHRRYILFCFRVAHFVLFLIAVPEIFQLFTRTAGSSPNISARKLPTKSKLLDEPEERTTWPRWRSELFKNTTPTSVILGIFSLILPTPPTLLPKCIIHTDRRKQRRGRRDRSGFVSEAAHYIISRYLRDGYYARIIRLEGPTICTERIS